MSKEIAVHEDQEALNLTKQMVAIEVRFSDPQFADRAAVDQVFMHFWVS